MFNVPNAEEVFSLIKSKYSKAEYMEYLEDYDLDLARELVSDVYDGKVKDSLLVDIFFLLEDDLVDELSEDI